MKILIKLNIIFFFSDWSAKNNIFVEAKKPKCFSKDAHPSQYFTDDHFDEIGIVRDSAVEIARILYKKMGITTETNSLCEQLVNTKVMKKAVEMIQEFNKRDSNKFKIAVTTEQDSFSKDITAAIDRLKKANAAEDKSPIIVELNNMREKYCVDYLKPIRDAEKEKAERQEAIAERRRKEREEKERKKQQEADDLKRQQEEEKKRLEKEAEDRRRRDEIEEQKRKVGDEEKRFQEEDEKLRLEKENEKQKRLAEEEENNRKLFELQKQLEAEDENKRRHRFQLIHMDSLGRESDNKEHLLDEEHKIQQVEAEERQRKLNELKMDAEKQGLLAGEEELNKKLLELQQQLEAKDEDRRRERFQLIHMESFGMEFESREHHLEEEHKMQQVEAEERQRKLNELKMYLDNEAQQRRQLFEDQERKQMEDLEKLRQELSVVKQKLQEEQEEINQQAEESEWITMPVSGA